MMQSLEARKIYYVVQSLANAVCLTYINSKLFKHTLAHIMIFLICSERKNTLIKRNTYYFINIKFINYIDYIFFLFSHIKRSPDMKTFFLI